MGGRGGEAQEIIRDNVETIPQVEAKTSQQEKMRRQMLKSKENAVIELQIDYSRLAKSMNTPGLDKNKIEKRMAENSEQRDLLEKEIKALQRD